MTTVQPPRRSRRSLLTSLAVLVALAVVAVVFHRPLVAFVTGKSLGGAGSPVTAQAGGFSLTAFLEPDPPATKGNALMLEVRDGTGKPVDAMIAVVYDMPAMGAMAEMKGNADVKHENDGRYRAVFDLPGEGTWSIHVNIQASSASASQTFKLTVGSRGLSTVGGGSSMPSTSTAVGGPPFAPIPYPPAALDPLRAAMDGVDRLRALLAHDDVNGVNDNARTIAEALRAATAALPKERAERTDLFVRAASDADDLAAAATSLEDARRAFAQLNRDLLPLLGTDARLTSGWHVFECPMFDRAPWMQRSEALANPYMGTKMLACGNPSTWQPPAPRATTTTRSAPGEIDHYTCSMHPSVKQQAPGKCPICGMDLVPVTKAQQEQGVVMIDAARRQLIGVRIGPVIEGPMRDPFRALGRVTYDESALADVNLKVRGWITHLSVTKTGQQVARGQPLFTMYSPELYNAQQDFLLATRGPGLSATPDAGSLGPVRGDALGRAARQRLRLLGMDETQIDAVAKKGAPMESVTVSSPASGFVIEKNVVDGAAVEAGMRLYRIAALDKVWIEAEVYEADLARVRVGQGVTVTLDYVPGHTYGARVAYVYPYLDTKTRTGRVRIEIPNKALDLRPGMYANVEFESDLGNRVQVPAAAVVYTGPRRLVFLDLGEGSFKPQEIHVGATANGMYEVISGLKPGDRVATSGAFLIAAEARISTAAKYWETSDVDADATSGHERHEAPPPASSTPNMRGMPVPKVPSFKPSNDGGSQAPSSSTPMLPPPTLYSCPMHPEVQSTKPGECPKCGMDLQMPKGKP